jgi:hypothetical protein
LRQSVGLKKKDVRVIGQPSRFDGLTDPSIIILVSVAQSHIDYKKPVTLEFSKLIAQKATQIEQTSVVVKEVVVKRDLQCERLSQPRQPQAQALWLARENNAVRAKNEPFAIRMLSG